MSKTCLGFATIPMKVGIDEHVEYGDLKVLP